MIGTTRLVITLAIAAVATPLLALWQLIAVRTGWLDERRAPRLWHRLVLRLLDFRVHVSGRPASDRPLFIVANHVSWTDIMVIGALVDVHFVSKSELAGWPIMGTLARLQRTVFVERERRRRSGDQAGEIARRLADGDPMAMFAEGSTSDGNLLQPFKSTLFGAAQMALDVHDSDAVTIQPVAIAYTRLHGIPLGRQHRPHVAWIGDRILLPHIKELLREGGVDLEVRFGAPLRFEAGTSRKRIAEAAEASVRAMMYDALRFPR